MKNSGSSMKDQKNMVYVAKSITLYRDIFIFGRAFSWNQISINHELMQKLRISFLFHVKTSRNL